MSLEANVYPILLRIGGFTLYSYGVIVVLAIVVGGYVARRLLKHLGLDPGLAIELAGAAALGGFAGARLYWLAEHWSEVRADVLHHAFAGAGFTWYGGLLGGVAAVISVAIFRRVPLGIVANVMAPAVALGYGVGRIACQLAGDGTYGRPSDLPWAMSYPHGVVPTTIRVQPTPVYETLSMVVVFLILYRLARRPQPGWFVFSWFLVLSGVERFAVEFLRRNPVWVAGLTPPQWFALASVAIGAFVLLAMRVRHARLEAEASHPAA
jgi:phosphatidylglycerol:prolipoprotein diacylglycerol transferase